MKIILHKMADQHTLEPLTCRRTLSDCITAGRRLGNALSERLTRFADSCGMKKGEFIINAAENFWPSEELFRLIAADKNFPVARDEENNPMLWIARTEDESAGLKNIKIDEKSIVVKYPWHILNIHEELMKDMKESIILGQVRENVTIDGVLILGKNSVILPGVYMEGNVIIGENSKIGPNAYIRGSTYVGNNCHVGQAVEIKNSILMDNVSAGHLSYLGDTIVCPKTNFGAGTITANFRHDGKNHRSAVDEKILDTGRRKFGAIIGDNVHTGIHTSIYPGRKIWADRSTLPGDIVSKDLHEKK